MAWQVDNHRPTLLPHVQHRHRHDFSGFDRHSGNSPSQLLVVLLQITTTMDAPSKPLGSIADQQPFTVLVTGANRQVLPCLPQQKSND